MEKSKETGWYEFQMFPNGYGKFPYLIWKVAYATFMQVPIHMVTDDMDTSNLPGGKLQISNPNSLSLSELIVKYEKELIDLIKIVNYNMKRTKGKAQNLFLVCSPNKAFYFDDEVIKESDSIPSYGNLLSMNNKLIGMVAKHYLKDQNS